MFFMIIDIVLNSKTRSININYSRTNNYFYILKIIFSFNIINYNHSNIDFVFLFIGAPPIIKEHPKSVVVRRNDPATLNCAASGATRFRWFRDGEEVARPDQNTRPHVVILPSGSLFFLRVAASRRDNDAGTYWCVASNSYGTSRSKNATLTVSSLDDEFQEEPEKDITGNSGHQVILNCRPPKGIPQPEVYWLKDDEEVSNSSRVYTTIEGNLAIKEALERDSGSYKCVAKNLAGTRESRPAVLSILSK